MNICLIPARGGSKRIPRKNIKEFNGKPIMVYSIEAAIKSECFNRIIVSTDDDEIADIAINNGAEVPFMRPKNLGDDFTSTAKVVEHSIKYYKDLGVYYKYACVVYPTAPLLESKYITSGYKKLKDSDAVYAFSATSMPFPVQRSFAIDVNGRCRMFNPEHFYTRSQDLENSYQDAGQFYWRDVERAENNNKITFSDIGIPILIPRHLVQDIDTEEDWKTAEYLYKAVYK